jgi:hypothetical protein
VARHSTIAGSADVGPLRQLVADRSQPAVIEVEDNKKGRS